MRPLRLQRRPRRAALRQDRPCRQLAAARAGRPRKALRLRRRGGGRDRPHGSPLRAERDRAGVQRLPDDDGARCLGPRPAADGARLDLRHQGRAPARPRVHDRGRRGATGRI